MLWVIKSVLAWFILALLSTNLLGSVVRGLFVPVLSTEGFSGEGAQLMEREIRRFYAANVFMTLLSAGLAVGYLFALNHYWNIWLAVAAGMLMVSRLPDLLWEIQRGERVTSSNIRRKSIDYAACMVLWLSMPVVAFALWQ